MIGFQKILDCLGFFIYANLGCLNSEWAQCVWSIQEGSVNYGELFAYALRSFGILCIGLYRFRDALSSVTQDPSAKRYVITNPPDDFLLLTSDKVSSTSVYFIHRDLMYNCTSEILLYFSTGNDVNSFILLNSCRQFDNKTTVWCLQCSNVAWA